MAVENRPLVQHLESAVQCGAVAQSFPGGRVGSARRVVGIAEQPVGRRHDVLDLGTRLSFEQGDGVDQHRLVRDEIPGDAELCQCRARGKLLGHNRIETTARYAHLARDTEKASAAKVAGSIGADILPADGAEAA